MIVTVSTNVLAAGKIKFIPDLPKRHLDAAGKLKLGSYDHVALELPGNPLGLRADELVFEKSESKQTAAIFGNAGGSSLCVIDVAGSFGRDLSAKGEPAMIDFALSWLTGLYGTDIKSAVKRSHATRWNPEPWALGAGSVAAPGYEPARKALMEPLNRVWLAGEAAHETLWGTVGGAWESGERAAAAVLKLFGRRGRTGRRRGSSPGRAGREAGCALHEVARGGRLRPGWLTTVTETFGRVSMHGVREELLMAQLAAAQLPATIVRIPFPCPNEVYEARMAAALAAAKAAGVTHVIFGDLFLEDVRRYREDKLAGSGITPLFPLWGRPTAALAHEMIDAGVQTYLVCVDRKQLAKDFAGRRFDHALLRALPPQIDPCGEKGEFHSFVAAGPMLSRSIPVTIGETVERDGFAYADVCLRAN